MIDTETDLGKGLIGPEEFLGSQGLNNGPFGGVNQQINFLNADLASVDRSITRMSLSHLSDRHFMLQTLTHIPMHSVDHCGWPPPVSCLAVHAHHLNLNLLCSGGIRMAQCALNVKKRSNRSSTSTVLTLPSSVSSQ